ncbi:unnamed protein product, partial [Polarella glacialis]
DEPPSATSDRRRSTRTASFADAVTGSPRGSEPPSSEEEEDESFRKVLFSSPHHGASDGGTPTTLSRGRKSRQASLGSRGTVLVPMRAGLCEPQVQGLREIFGLFDLEGSGRICPKAVRQSASDIGMEKDAPEIWRLLASLDGGDEADGVLDFEEFLSLICEQLGDHYSMSGTSRLLNLMGQDAVAAGSVGLADLRLLVDDLGLDMDDEELEEMLEQAGSNADGRVDLDSFYAVMQKPES